MREELSVEVDHDLCSALEIYLDQGRKRIENKTSVMMLLTLLNAYRAANQPLTLDVILDFLSEALDDTVNRFTEHMHRCLSFPLTVKDQ